MKKLLLIGLVVWISVLTALSVSKAENRIGTIKSGIELSRRYLSPKCYILSVGSAQSMFGNGMAKADISIDSYRGYGGLRSSRHGDSNEETGTGWKILGAILIGVVALVCWNKKSLDDETESEEEEEDDDEYSRKEIYGSVAQANAAVEETRRKLEEGHPFVDIDNLDDEELVIDVSEKSEYEMTEDEESFDSEGYEVEYKQKKRRNLIIIFSAIAVVIIGAIIFFLLNDSDETQQEDPYEMVDEYSDGVTEFHHYAPDADEETGYSDTSVYEYYDDDGADGPPVEMVEGMRGVEIDTVGY